MLRCGNLNGNNISYDKDFSLLVSSLLSGGIVSGFGVTTNAVWIGKAVLEATRTNGEVVLVAVENTTSITIDTTGTKKVRITIDQTKLDDGTANLEDGTGIITVATGASYPASNYIRLASITSGVITDTRIMATAKAIPEVQTAIQNQTYIAGTSGGSANAFTFYPTIWPTAYVASQKFCFKANFTITGSATLNVYSDQWILLWAKTIKKLDWSTNLSSGDIVNGQEVEVVYDGTNFQMVSPIGQLETVDFSAKYFSFWDGSDGAVTISTNTTLTRDMNYTNLTVNNGYTLNPNWFKIYVSWTLTLNGTISRDGNAGGAWSTYWAWGGWGALNAGTLWIELAWGNWGNWQSYSAGSPSYAWTWSSTVYGFLDSAGVNWGASYQAWWTWWGSKSRLSRMDEFIRTTKGHIQVGVFSFSPWLWVSWGGGWWNYWSAGAWNYGWAWGGGGGNGWQIFIEAYTMSLASTSIISSNGWVWWAGSASNSSGYNGGGGGGGSGWIINIMCNNITQTAWWIIRANGANWWATTNQTGWWGGNWGLINVWKKTSTISWTVTVTAWTWWTGWTAGANWAAGVINYFTW